jgi:GxxExxY protein
MHENEIARLIVDAAFRIHSKLGPGLLESVYQVVLAYGLRKLGLKVEREVPVVIEWDNLTFDKGFELDLLVEDKVIVEVKSVEKVHPVHKKQLLTHLRLKKCKLGLLINFNEVLIKDGVSRVVNGLEE